MTITSVFERLSLFTALAALGLAASSAVAIAQPGGPPSFQCPAGEWINKVVHGTNDNFAPGGTESTSPSAALQSGLNVNLSGPSNVYDHPGINYQFGDTLAFAPPAGYTVTKARLTMRLKPNGSAGNDTIDIASFPPGARVGYSIANLPNGANWVAPKAPVLFVFDFTPGSVTVYGNNLLGNPAAAPPYNGTAFFAALNANKQMDFKIQDDTGGDYAQLEICAKPPAPKYDLVATKKHDGNTYMLHVTNAGSPIMPTGHIDVTEIVPAGLVVYGTSGNPWQCPGVTFPVVGPDAFTCSYQIPNGGIGTNASLPVLSIKTEGKPECPNCMKAKLYLNSFQDGRAPVNEGDMKNNASCTK